jgi:hypothetical protein
MRSRHLASWQMGCLVWLGMTLSCRAMTSLTDFFDRAILPPVGVEAGK